MRAVVPKVVLMCVMVTGSPKIEHRVGIGIVWERLMLLVAEAVLAAVVVIVAGEIVE